MAAGGRDFAVPEDREKKFSTSSGDLRTPFASEDVGDRKPSMSMLSLLPNPAAMSGMSLTSILSANDPFLEHLYSSASGITPSTSTSSFFAPPFLKEPYSMASTSSSSGEDRPFSPEDIKLNVVGPLKMPASMSLIRASKLCHVCESPGAAPHYGGIVCGGCKIFFARAVQKKTYYVCDKNGKCKMMPGKRSKCRSCRFQRCLKARMCPEEVGKLRDLKMPDQLMVPKEEGTIVPYFEPGALKAAVANERLRMVNELSDQYSGILQIQIVAMRFVGVEKSCDNDAFPIPVPEQYNCSLNISVADAMRNPLLVCERTPLSWSSRRERLLSTEQEFKQSYCRLVLHYLEWILAVDDIFQFRERHRLSLVTNRMCPMVLMTMAYNTYKFKSDRLLLCHGNGIKMEDIDEREFRPLVLLLNGLQSLVIDKMAAIQLTEQEYAILKIISLFTLTEPLGCEEAVAGVRTLRHKYEHFLTILVKEQEPESNRDKVYARIRDMLDIIAALSRLAEIPSMAFVNMVIMNLANMRGELTYDMHIRRYE